MEEELKPRLFQLTPAPPQGALDLSQISEIHAPCVEVLGRFGVHDLANSIGQGTTTRKELDEDALPSCRRVRRHLRWQLPTAQLCKGTVVEALHCSNRLPWLGVAGFEGGVLQVRDRCRLWKWGLRGRM